MARDCLLQPRPHQRVGHGAAAPTGSLRPHRDRAGRVANSCKQVEGGGTPERRRRSAGRSPLRGHEPARCAFTKPNMTLLQVVLDALAAQVLDLANDELAHAIKT